MIIDQLFEDNNKKKLNETTSRNYEQGMTEGEVEMPTGQATGTDTPPSRSFAVKIVHDIGRQGMAYIIWTALEDILPRDYPRVPFQKQTRNEPQARVLFDLHDDGFSIVKQNISSQDIAETIASKFEGKGIAAEVIDGGIYEEQGQDPVATATQNTLDKLGSRVGAAAGSNIDQVTDAYQQSLLDRMGKRFGLPPGSSMEQVQAAQQAHLDQNDPAAAAQYKQNMTNIEAGNTAANKPVTLAPKAAPAATATPATTAKPSLGADFDAGLAAQKAGGSPVDIMLAQPTIANNQKLVDAIGSVYGLPAGSSVEQVKAAAKGKPAAPTAPAQAAPAAAPAPVAEGQGPAYIDNMMNDYKASLPGQGAPVAAAPAEYTPKVGEEILWRPRFAKMVPVPVTVVAAAPGKLTIKLQSPRMIQNYGKDTIVVDLEKSDVTPKQSVAESRQRRLNEAMLMEDPVYRKFKGVGRYIAERKMSEKEILQVFADAEAGMTNKDTGANRTFLGRGKDTTMDFAGGVKDAMTSVLNSIQNSTPVAAVDVAYDQATDALANVAGGQKGAVMGAIKKYRNLVKQYPKTAGFAKAALVAIAGLATGGAGLPAIAGLTYALDSAIKGDKLSSVLGKGAGAAALSAAGQAAFGGNATPGDDVATIDAVDTPGGVEATDYVVKKGDTLSDIAKANKVSVDDLMKANAGQTIVKPNGESITWNDANAFSDVNAMGDYTGPGTGVQQDYSVSTAPKIANPDVLAAGQTIKLPAPTGATPYAGDVGLAGDTWNKIGAGQYPASQISANQAAKYGLKESIKFKILPAEKLIDQKSTVLSWALSESVGRKSISLNLTTLGTYTVFENVDRYRKAIMELKGVPGSTRPDQYRPDMPGGAGVTSKPGLIGKGLNWLDKKASQVGGALSNFGHQFTTGVTKEKLKMNWHQAGKPSDSDQLAAWLTKQGVPQEVVTTVYGKMGIPYVAPASAEPASAEPASAEPGAPAKPATGGAQKSLPFYGTNPDTNKAWTRDELLAKGTAPASAAPAASPAVPATTTAQSPAGFNAANVMNLPGMEKYAKQPAPAKTPNFGAGPGGYSNVTTSFKPTAPAKAPVAPTAPAGTRVTSGGPTPDEQAKLAQRIAQATAKPVAEMLRMVETKEDVAKIKHFIDQTFVKYGAVTESAFVVRNQLIDHVTQVGAQRRREFARKG